MSPQEFDTTMVMRDGISSMPISPAVAIAEDSPTLQSVTIAIGNAVHLDEGIAIVEESLPANISVSSVSGRFANGV